MESTYFECLESTQMTKKFRFLVVMSLVCAVLSGGCGNGGNKTTKIHRTPAEKEKAGLMKKIDRKFDNPQAHYELGQLYQADGLWTQAEYEYNTALDLDPVYVEAQAAMVKVLQKSEPAKSQIYADIYSSQAASSASRSLQLALAFQKQQLDEYALGSYQQALRLAPNSAKVNRQVGFYYLTKGDKVRAKDYLTRSFNLDRNQPDVAMELGKLGIAIQLPRKTKGSARKLDKIVDRSDKDLLK